MLPKLLLLDLDGTVRNCTVQDQPTPNHVGEQALIVRAVERMREAQQAGVKIAFVTNAGGVGMGYQSKGEWENVMLELRSLLMQVGVDAAPSRIPVYVSFDAPGHGTTRKPSPAMLLQAMNAAWVKPADTVMVGDLPEDEQAAKAAGVRFMHSEAWWAWGLVDRPGQ